MRQTQLKEVSKAKLRILEKYFPAWAKILGSRYQILVYVDCFAGAGRYAGGEAGSPLVVLDKARELVQRTSTLFEILAIFVEKDKDSAETLRRQIPASLPGAVTVEIFNEDAHNFIPSLLRALPDEAPAFFFIDPYGHPLTIPEMNRILSRPRREILLNLMWYAINMHLNNPKARSAIDRMFGHSSWASQSFMRHSGAKRESLFLDYFLSKLQAKYKLPFKIRFSPEDNVPGGSHRTKYYIIHLSNHPKAVLLMKEVMWSIGDEEGTFDYSATHQGVLFSCTPRVQELIAYLRQNYVDSGRRLTFDQLREETWMLPFIEKHYRNALRQLESEGAVQIRRIDSKKTGIRGRDLVEF